MVNLLKRFFRWYIKTATVCGNPNTITNVHRYLPIHGSQQLEARFFKTHPKARIPTQAHSEYLVGDSGFDLYSVDDAVVRARDSAVVPVGLKLAYVTPGFWFRVEARSGLGFKHGIQPHFGIIDNPYRGDLGIKLYNLTDTDYTVKQGDRIAQIIFYPLVQPKVSFTDVVIESTRGEKGFGASGN